VRKADLKVGEEYAAGSTSRYDRWKLAHVRLVELEGERVVQEWNGSRRRRGIVVALVEDHDEYLLRGKAGDEKVLPSARDIIEPWAPYAEALACKRQSDAERAAERNRVRGVAEDVQVRLRAIGAPEVRFSDGVFRVPADAMAKIVAMIPDGR
jgi:hypothetical protein